MSAVLPALIGTGVALALFAPIFWTLHRWHRNR